MAANFEPAVDASETSVGLWASADARTVLLAWTGGPGEYALDGVDRADFTEIVTICKGSCEVQPKGGASVELTSGSTYVMTPGWTGTWVVRERVMKTCVWLFGRSADSTDAESTSVASTDTSSTLAAHTNVR